MNDEKAKKVLEEIHDVLTAHKLKAIEALGVLEVSKRIIQEKSITLKMFERKGVLK